MKKLLVATALLSAFLPAYSQNQVSDSTDLYVLSLEELMTIPITAASKFEQSIKKYGHQLFGLYKRFNLQIEGKGIGLYLIKSEIESLRGHIEVESVLGEGTTFRILLPFITPETLSKKLAEEAG